MKKLCFLFLLASATVSTVTAQTADSAKQTTQHDKAFLLNYYQETFDKLEKSVKGLSPAQLQFKPAADKWSVSQCLEHIILTEKMLLGYTQQTMSQAPNPERRKEIKLSDDDVIQGMTNRSHKAKASPELTPEGKYTDAAVALAELRDQRKVLLAYIDGLSLEDMRNRVADSPFGPVDGYHSVLYIPGHTARHTLQIEEVKEDPNFPKQ